ncbi:MAG: sigma-54-dependent transcriptional regulator, partial [Acidobacteriota bacterium]
MTGKSSGKVFLVDDDDVIVSMLGRTLKKDGYDVDSESRKFSGIVDRIRSWGPDIVLLDIKLGETSGLDILREIKSRKVNTQVIMLTSDDNVETGVKCMKLGASDYLTKPFNIDEVKIVISNIIEKGKLKNEVDYLRGMYSELFRTEIIGESDAIKELRQKAAKIASAKVPTILITGESGTGKELVARYIHKGMHSDPEAACVPFIAVNCTALPESLLESELFGYEKGAFTDAKSEKKGIFELAHTGTILLDEIGDMKQSLQGKLLRVLEERSVRRIGGHEEIPIEVTVIATTNRNLAEAVEAGDFRTDLFYRLNVFSLQMPPLRERGDDSLLLTKYFLRHFADKYKNKKVKGFSADAEKVIREYDWQGNVRELRNVIERIVVLENAEIITAEYLPKEMSGTQSPQKSPAEHRFLLPDSGVSLDDIEKDLIIQALKKTS